MLAAKNHLAGETRFVFGWGDILMDVANYPRFAHQARDDDYDLLLAVNRVKDPFRGAAVYLSKRYAGRATRRKTRSGNREDGVE